MKILYISYDGMTDPLGQSQVIPYLSGLSSLGYEIQLISCEKKERFNKYESTISDLLKKNKISWYPVSYSRLPSIFSKQFNLYGIKKTAIEICHNSKPDVVHCRSYMAALIGLKLKLKYNTMFIFDMRGFWADERIDGKIWNLKNTLHKKIYNFFKKKEIEFLLNADHTISLTQNAKDEILSWKELKGRSIPIRVIPCCADLELFSAENISLEKKKNLETQTNISDKDFIISYLGSIGTWYMLEEMLDFFICLLQAKENAKFLIITPDDPQSIYDISDAKKIAREKLIIVEAKRNEVPLYLSLSDIAIYFIRPLYSKKASSPTKTAEIMGMGIPIITNTGIGDSDKIIRDSKAGLLINDFNSNEYLRVINEIDVILKTEKKKIVEQAGSYFSLSKGVDLYAHVYKTLKEKITNNG
jgi:glycosyltransferase involved in cell wall biosynthesis